MKISKKILKTIYILEVVLAFFITVSVLFGIVNTFEYFRIISVTPTLQAFSIMQSFLGHILTLVIGLELAIMLVRHTPSSVIEVLLYAIARKIVIDSKTTLDILLGIVAISVLFFIHKYFEPARNFITDINIVNPATLVEDLNRKLNTNIPKDLGNTIGGVISKISQESGEKLHEGKTLRVADAEITILSMDAELIKEIKVIKLEEKEDMHNGI